MFCKHELSPADEYPCSACDCLAREDLFEEAEDEQDDA
jgi:hypothetical protein